MAKVSFTQITPIKEQDDKIVKFENKDIVVKQYLSIKDKADLVDYIVQSGFDNTGLFSPVRQEIYQTIGMLRWYTNINFTDTMLLNIEKTYDAIVLNNIKNILTNIPEKELNTIETMINDSIAEVKEYIRSFAGQLRATQNDYDATKLDLEEISKSLEDPEKIGFVKELMEKMG